jgi:hypothetical protein
MHGSEHSEPLGLGPEPAGPDHRLPGHALVSVSPPYPFQRPIGSMNSMPARSELADDASRPIIFYTRDATCWHSRVKGLTMMVNSVFNGWRMEDVWLGN